MTHSTTPSLDSPDVTGAVERVSADGELVLSLFPGIGLLDQAFEEAGFCVVRGPDLIWGGDIRRFYPTPGRFAGIIGGPPCQRFSGLGNVNISRWGDDAVMPNMIPEFERCVLEAQPEWFLMENVPRAPIPVVDYYAVSARICNNRWFGGEQDRVRRFSFGHREPDVCAAFHVRSEVFEPQGRTGAIISTGQNGNGGPRASISAMATAQGIDPSRFDNSPFTTTELRRAIANGVPLPMGRAVARAVSEALSLRKAAA